MPDVVIVHWSIVTSFHFETVNNLDNFSGQKQEKAISNKPYAGKAYDNVQIMCVFEWSVCAFVTNFRKRYLAL